MFYGSFCAHTHAIYYIPLPINKLHCYICLLFIFQTYDQAELLQAKLDILSKTNMIDYVIDIRRMLYPDEDTPEVCTFSKKRLFVKSQNTLQLSP